MGETRFRPRDTLSEEDDMEEAGPESPAARAVVATAGVTRRYQIMSGQATQVSTASRARAAPPYRARLPLAPYRLRPPFNRWAGNR